MARYSRVRRTLDILPRYAFMAFIGVLGLFNSTKLEIRQVTNTNAELLFQNGQIVSVALILICISGFLGESFAIFRYRKRKWLPGSSVPPIQDDPPHDDKIIEEVVSEEE
mgnify:CR=1 FL=1